MGNSILVENLDNKSPIVASLTLLNQQSGYMCCCYRHYEIASLDFGSYATLI